VYIADYENHRIRKLTMSSGRITTIAGTGNSGYNFDDIAATSCSLNHPFGLVLDPSGRNLST